MARRETDAEKLDKLLNLPAYRRTTSLQGPRPIVKPEDYPEFLAQLQRLRDGARHVYGRATTIDGKRHPIPPGTLAEYEANVAKIKFNARRDRETD